ncbi:LANO_0D02388g1_1 [Lachancea nothofagi CBS 11611]|uniref:LANO_0D02388g1_1 n=1 Tax=Lachancea nothofagi CBS 11611 TaxID=1266666 RepID=A0A1G4JEB2_9SACH|nr:LANO_0D02388g1_1 [Lachancea nothofagi CBS 11611]
MEPPAKYAQLASLVRTADGKKKKSSTLNELPNRSPVRNEFASLKTDAHILVDAEDPLSIQEKLALALFTTRPGLCILKLYYGLSCGHINLNRYKKWQNAKNRPEVDGCYKNLVKKWIESTTYLSLLMDNLLQNDQHPLDYTQFSTAPHKMSLGFLLDRETELLIIDDDYNLLLDFLLHCRLKIEKLLNEADLPSLLAKVSHKNNRLFQLSGRFIWYTFTPQEFEESQDIVYKYLTVLTDKLTAQQDLIPQLRPLFGAMNSSKVTHLAKKDSSQGDYLDSDSNSDSEQWPSKKSNSQDRVYSFDLNDDGSFEAPNVFSKTRKRHHTLYHVLKLQQQNSSPLLKSQFFTLCALVDPVTQPIPNDSHIVSIDLLSDMFLGLLSAEIKELSINWRFHVCFNLQKIIHASLPRLNCHDFQKLNSVNNSDESVDWRRNLHKWLPQGLNTQDLELIYMVDILAIYLQYKLYEDLPVQMNPFLAPMISLWKNLTFVVLLGLEIDRFEEEHETFDTPVIVRATIRGASALRSVVATVLNGHVDYKRHDFKHEPINIFMSPHGRKLCHGALYTDVRSHAAAMLALGVDLEDVTNLLSDLQPGDRFDEDVKYMFDYEYDNYNEVDTEEMDEEELEDIESRERIKEMRAYYKRCHCQFDDDELLPDDEDETEASVPRTRSFKEAPPDSNVKISANVKPMAQRSKREGIDFDFNGRDWRDIPRGLNFYFNEHYTFEKRIAIDTANSLMVSAADRKLSLEEGTKLLRIVATCVAREQEQTVFQSVFAGEQDQKPSNHYTPVADGDLTTDYIYERWCEDALFERILLHNETLIWRFMDEMLMCSGYRRVLIWFITHLELSSSMIEYIYILVLGGRGEKVLEGNDANPSEESQYDQVLFSRQGSLQLSEIEVKMLLQEFFTNAAIFFSRQAREHEHSGDEESEEEHAGNRGISTRVVGLMKLVCLMVKRLMIENKFDFKDPDYIFELQTLLMSWICILPEARDLFFELRSRVDEESVDGKPISLGDTAGSGLDAQQYPSGVAEKINQDPTSLPDKNSDTSISVYNKRLISLLPPIAGSENSAVTALRSFISKHSLTMKTAVFGRRVISQDDDIMGMYMSDREMDNRHFLAEFGIDYNDLVDGVYGADFVYD